MFGIPNSIGTSFLSWSLIFSKIVVSNSSFPSWDWPERSVSVMVCPSVLKRSILFAVIKVCAKSVGTLFLETLSSIWAVLKHPPVFFEMSTKMISASLLLPELE